MRASNTKNAFTLVEILMVVLILGIASAIIIPSLGTRDDLRASSAARAIMADLIYAQNRAIATQTKHFIRFTGDTYTLYPSTAMATPLTHPVNKTPYVTTFGNASPMESWRTVTLGAPTLGAPGRTIIGFDEMGSPFAMIEPNGVEFPLSDAGQIPIICGSFTMTIYLEPFTGDVSVR
jgi:prepilin-type N-terminal cleavage/methylation domain-containing protein